jgi:hypothetical protein
VKWLGLVVALALAMAPAFARPAAASCDPATAPARTEAIRAHLRGEARRARTWDLAWGVGLGALAGVQTGFLVAEWVPLRDFDHAAESGLRVDLAKAVIGSASHFVLPLRVPQAGAASGDACASLEAAERTLRAAAREERLAFWLNHAGNLGINAAGLLWLGLVDDEWQEGLVSFATGMVGGLVAVYTQPRGRLRAARDGRLLGTPRSAAWGLTVTPGFAGVWLHGDF